MNTKTMIAAGGLAMALAIGAGAGAGAQAAAPVGAVGVTKALATPDGRAGVEQVHYRHRYYYGRPYYGWRPYRPYWGPPVVYRPAPYYYAPYYAPPVYYYPY